MSPSATFKVIFLESAKGDIRVLYQRAIELGAGDVAQNASQSATESLTNEPLVFGDHEYKTRRPGGMVCHGNRPPFYFRFAAYELERVVFVYRVLPIPLSILDVPQ